MIRGYEEGVDTINFTESVANGIGDIWGSFNDSSQGYLVIGDFAGNRITIEDVTSWAQFDTDDLVF